MAIFIGVQRHSNIYVFCNKTRAKYASTCKTTGHPDVLSVTISKPITHLGIAPPVASAVLWKSCCVNAVINIEYSIS